MANVAQVLRATGVIPVIKLEDEQKAVSLGRALLEGGIPAAEVTFRTPAAAKSIENIAKALPEMFVCAGTVLSVEQAKLLWTAAPRLSSPPAPTGTWWSGA